MCYVKLAWFCLVLRAEGSLTWAQEVELQTQCRHMISSCKRFVTSNSGNSGRRLQRIFSMRCWQAGKRQIAFGNRVMILGMGTSNVAVQVLRCVWIFGILAWRTVVYACRFGIVHRYSLRDCHVFCSPPPPISRCCLLDRKCAAPLFPPACMMLLSFAFKERGCKSSFCTLQHCATNKQLRV